jgi:hypothetical protein
MSERSELRKHRGPGLAAHWCSRNARLSDNDGMEH